MRFAKTAAITTLTAAAFALGHATGVAAPPQQSPQEEMKAMEAAWDAMGQTGKMHKLLEPFIGVWQSTATFYSPMGEMTSTGTMTNSWIMDGKIMKEEYSGTFEGESFEGMGLWAYSTPEEEYQALWIDSMSTHIDFVRGHEVSADGKTWTVQGEQILAPGQKVPYEDVIKIVGDNEHRFTRTLQTPTGPVKSMEIVYTR